MATGWCVPAFWSKPWANDQLVNFDDDDEWKTQQVFKVDAGF